MRCPVCEAAQDGERCACGYDFATKNPYPSLAISERRLRNARALLAFSVVMSVLSPLCVLAGSLLVPALMITVVTAIVTWVAGLVGGQAAKQRLVKARAMLPQLPAARVIR
jgi:hypothetical protein